MTPQQHPEVVDPLAAEYVLGTLRGPARRRFQAWRAGFPAVEERCRFWEEHLLQLARTLRPIDPPARVWHGVRARLNLPGSELRRRPARTWAIAASVLLVAGLAAWLYWTNAGPGPVSQLATISTPEGSQLWEVDIHRGTGRMVVHTGKLATQRTDRDYELWALPAGGAPVSLGVLPARGSTQRALTAAQLQALTNSQQLAVTLEPVGGSPTGKPSGAPIFVAPLRAPS